MALPQRNDDPIRGRQEPRQTLRAVEPAPAAPGQRSIFWIWIVLFIAAIIWFCGWGWGGYGGWWWGRANGPAVQTRTGGTTGGAANGAAAGNGAATGTASGNPNGGAANGGATGTPAGPNGTTSGSGSAGPAGNSAPPR